MAIKRIWGCYFSPVGNTKKIVEGIAKACAEHLNVEVKWLNFTTPALRKDKFYEFPETDLVIFGMPTYAGRLPNKALPFIKELFKGNKTLAIPVVTFGNRNFDSSLTELNQELQEIGFHCLAGGAFVCQHSFSNKLASGRPNVEDEALIVAFVERIVEIINCEANYSQLVIEGREEVQAYYTPLGIDGNPTNFLKAKPQTNMESCHKCGLCAAVCPMGAIDFKDTSLVPGICIKCQACVRKCPKGAKYFDDAQFLSHVKMLESNYCDRKEAALYYARLEK